MGRPRTFACSSGSAQAGTRPPTGPSKDRPERSAIAFRAPANDQGCGTVNSGLIPVAWPYTPSQGAAGSIPSGGFVEGGINLTELGIPGCFSSFMAETRSSPSVDATLKDFVLGSFEACDSNLTTTPGTSATPSVALTDTNANSIPDIGIGTGTVAVKDKASMVVNGIDTWTGNLKFFICGPIASGECTSGGVQIGPAAGVTMDNTTAQQDSAAANLTSVGRYCWRAEFTSAHDRAFQVTATRPAGECFEVLPVTPSLDTAAVTSPVNLGDAAQDNATLSGTATQPGTNGGNATYPSINATNGAAAGGKITFTLLKADCTDPGGRDGHEPAGLHADQRERHLRACQLHAERSGHLSLEGAVRPGCD